jgi:hypothetical protein
MPCAGNDTGMVGGRGHRTACRAVEDVDRDASTRRCRVDEHEDVDQFPPSQSGTLPDPAIGAPVIAWRPPPTVA